MLAGDAGGGVIAADHGAPLAEGESPATLQLMVRDSYLSGIPFLVRVQVEGPDGRVDRDLWDADFSLSTDNPAVVLSYDSDQTKLVNGMGSVLVTVQGNHEFSLTAHCSGAAATKHLVPLSEAPVQEYSGTLPGEKTTFSGVVRVTGDLIVPPRPSAADRSRDFGPDPGSPPDAAGPIGQSDRRAGHVQRGGDCGAAGHADRGGSEPALERAGRAGRQRAARLHRDHSSGHVAARRSHQQRAGGPLARQRITGDGPQQHHRHPRQDHAGHIRVGRDVRCADVAR